VQSHVRLGVFFYENPQNQPDAKELSSTALMLATACSILGQNACQEPFLIYPFFNSLLKTTGMHC